MKTVVTFTWNNVGTACPAGYHLAKFDDQQASPFMPSTISNRLLIENFLD